MQQENRELLAHRASADAQQVVQQHEQSKVRFRTVFENSPLGQKIITSDLLHSVLFSDKTSKCVGRKGEIRLMLEVSASLERRPA